MFDKFFNNGSSVSVREGCKKSNNSYVKEGCKKSNNSSVKEGCKNSYKRESTCKLCESSPCKCKKDSPLNKASKAINDRTKAIRDKLYNNKESVREALVSEVIYNLLEESLGMQIDNSFQYNVMKRNLVESYVKEKGTNNLINKFKSMDLPFYEAGSLCEEYVDKIVCNLEEVDDCYIDQDAKKSFLKDMKNLDFSDITSMVQTRVLGAIDDFNVSNKQLRMDLEDLLKQSEERMASAKTEQSRLAYEREYISKQNALRDNKVKNIYECFVEDIAKAALYKDELSSYRLESGKLDMVKINSNAKVMYTFLEVLNTSTLEKIDSDYISDVLRSMKK